MQTRRRASTKSGHFSLQATTSEIKEDLRKMAPLVKKQPLPPQKSPQKIIPKAPSEDDAVQGLSMLIEKSTPARPKTLATASPQDLFYLYSMCSYMKILSRTPPKQPQVTKNCSTHLTICYHISKSLIN